VNGTGQARTNTGVAGIGVTGATASGSNSPRSSTAPEPRSHGAYLSTWRSCYPLSECD
jgi:hypothetical protein